MKPQEPKPADTMETLGKLIGPEQKRDAIHIAVEPVIADEELEPGTHVGFMPNGRVASDYDTPVGIIDPYFQGTIYRGQRCWLFLYPKTITSLRHVWEHPGFPASELALQPAPIKASSPLSLSEIWIHDYADGIGVDYEELLDHARGYIDHDEAWSEGGRFEGESIPEEFWMHYENVTGEKVSNRNRGSFFSCSC